VLPLGPTEINRGNSLQCLACTEHTKSTYAPRFRYNRRLLNRSMQFLLRLPQEQVSLNLSLNSTPEDSLKINSKPALLVVALMSQEASEPRRLSRRERSSRL
jgi:hypothetical protein